MKSNLSIIILGQNVAHEILPALKTSQFANEIIYVDTNTGSTDNTLQLVRKYAHKIVSSPGYNFSKWRNDGAKVSSSDWLLYLDSDERITTVLAKEIDQIVSSGKSLSAYDVPRYEVFLGKHLNHWGDPYVRRLFKKSAFKRWEGKLHEQPIIEGEIGRLTNQLVHLSHKNIDEKIQGTIRWSVLEAEMLFEAKHPPMAGWRLWRIMFTEFIDRFFKKRLFLDGIEGHIEIIYQLFSRYMTYVRLWELQRTPSLKETYADIDRKLLKDWDDKGFHL